jgi:hypothetical protein
MQIEFNKHVLTPSKKQSIAQVIWEDLQNALSLQMKYVVKCRVVRLVFIQQLDDIRCFRSLYGALGKQVLSEGETGQMTINKNISFKATMLKFC